MLNMILKMSGVTALYVLLTIIVWRLSKGRKFTPVMIAVTGVIYGICSVLSTHFGVSYNNLLLLNVRDIGPLAAGLFFHPVSGVIAGLIGGIERYIAGTYWGIGSYTTIACSISTCLAGFVSVFLTLFIFKRRKPSPTYAFFMGAVMEVFHMYVVLITHRDDMKMAYVIVRACSAPMIIFTGLGMFFSSTALQILSGEWRNPFKRVPKEDEHVSDRFQIQMFAVIAVIFLVNFLFNYFIQSQTAIQNAHDTLTGKAESIIKSYQKIQKSEIEMESVYYAGDNEGTFDIIKSSGAISEGNHKNFSLPADLIQTITGNPNGGFFRAVIFNRDSVCRTDSLGDDLTLLTMLPADRIYEDRDIHTIETAFADILLMTAVYVLISLLVQEIVVKNLDLVNRSLKKITGGDLNEVVKVRNSSEFASLSDDINKTVDVLKGYISEAEHRIEEELKLAATIQESVLPKNFSFPRNDFEIFASMDPAREVGGDFYDFFLIGKNRLALVIADVSGKGIPAALFMMRSKTMIRSQAEEGKSPSEIFRNVNEDLCEGNDAEMFVTVWIGILNLDTGLMECSNAGHEYPILMRTDEAFTLYRDRHSLALGAMPGVRFRDYELQFQPGDKLFVYTDGIPEAINEKEELYGIDRMVQSLNGVKNQPMEEILNTVSKNLSEFVSSADQFDDITMLGLQYNGAERKALSMHFPAAVDQLDQVLGFVDRNLEAAGCPMKTQMQIDIAVEELFVNVANYAYQPEVGDVKISLQFYENPKRVMIVMKDSGKPFDPVEKADPDVTLSAEERQIGGLGIYMAKKNLDEMTYKRENGKNVLTLWKQIGD